MQKIARFLAVPPPRVGLLFRTGCETGLAISDLLLLRHEHLQDSCIVTRRIKTSKPVRVRISERLFQELKVALPFWTGKRLSGVTLWSRDLRIYMARADMLTPGAVCHRMCDTYADRALAAGIPIAVIAAEHGRKSLSGSR